MKYDKNIFIYNLNYLTSYGYEPELTIKLKNKSVFLVAYQDYIELSMESNETIKINKVEELFNYINFEDVLCIEGNIDFKLPIESQSIVVDGTLWLDGVPPTEVMSKFKKKFLISMWSSLIYFLGISIYFLITIINSETFDNATIIACSIYFGSFFLIIIFCLLCIHKKNMLIKKYYGVVSEDDQQLAKELLEKISIVKNNEYEVYDAVHFNIKDLHITMLLKNLIKGKKVYIALYKPIKIMEQELLNNNTNKQYNDIEFNDYVYKLVDLLEKNLYDF